MRVWEDVHITGKRSIQSEFCILKGDQSAQKSPLLESLARDVLKSVEGLAQDEVNTAISQDDRYIRLFIFPVIVTNAQLRVCSFMPHDISIEYGTLGDSDVETSTVPFIRFRKSLETDFPQGTFRSLKEANYALRGQSS
jgi:hypothetical protein